MDTYLKQLKPSELNSFIRISKGILDSLSTYDDLADLPPPVLGTVSPLYIEGIWFKRDGVKYTPRGASLCHIKNNWGTPYQITLDKILIEPNIDIVRVPAHDGDIANNNFLEDNYYPAIQELIDAGKYVIIDCHLVSNWNSSSSFDQCYIWMEKVAKKYRDCPNVLFEFYNEPISPTDDTLENWLLFRDMYQPVIDMIRYYAPNNIILCGNPSWSTRIKYAGDNPFAGGNLAYVRHLYPNHTNDVSSFMNQEMPLDKLAIAMTEVGYSENTGAHHDISNNPAFDVQTKEFFEDNPQVMQIYWAFDDGCQPAMLAPNGARQYLWMKDILSTPVQYVELLNSPSDVAGLVYEYNAGDVSHVPDAGLSSNEFTFIFKANAPITTQDRRLFISGPFEVIRKGANNKITIRYTATNGTTYINSDVVVPDSSDFWLIIRVKPSGFSVEYAGQAERSDTNNPSNGVVFGDIKIGASATWGSDAHSVFAYDRLITEDEKEKLLNFIGFTI